MAQSVLSLKVTRINKIVKILSRNPFLYEIDSLIQLTNQKLSTVLQIHSV